MDRKEVMDILEKIQVYRQSFLITNAVINEWERILKPYDYHDVNRKLDDYFRDGDNFGKYPDVYYLTRFLKTKEEKQVTSKPHAICQICKGAVDYEKYQEHYERCNSIEYITEMAERYFNKKLSKEKLRAVDKNKFDEYYYGFCKKLFGVMPEGFPKHLLENVLLTYEGKEPKYGLEEITEELKKI